MVDLLPRPNAENSIVQLPFTIGSPVSQPSQVGVGKGVEDDKGRNSVTIDGEAKPDSKGRPKQSPNGEPSKAPSGDGDVLPYDAAAGWVIADPCEAPCDESLDGGHFVNHWAEVGDLVNYHYWIAREPDAPPPTLWVEWRFRSNHPLGPIFYGCDAMFTVHYGAMAQLVNIYGDAVISHSGGDFVTGLDLDEFHTYRYESLDGIDYTMAVDGQVFIDRSEDYPNASHYLQMGGTGGCVSDWIPDMVNEWDHVWFGTLSSDEQIVATDPPQGNLDPSVYADLDRFTVTFDAPSYVYLDDITVEVTGGIAPTVTQTRRLDNSDPEVLEIVFDGPLPLNERTTFSFDDGETVNVVTYVLGELPAIPTVSEWGLLAMTLLLLTAGTVVIIQRRKAPLRPCRARNRAGSASDR